MDDREEKTGKLKQDNSQSPQTLILKIEKIQYENPDYDIRDVLAKAFQKDFTEDIAKPKTPTNPKGAGRKRTQGVRKGSPGALVGGAKRTKEGKALAKKFGSNIFRTRAVKKEIRKGVFVQPFDLFNQETGTIVLGESIQSLENKQMQPVSSSNVKAIGQYNNELLVQFRSGQGGTYRYTFRDPTTAEAAFTSLINSSSPGRWVWRNMRGHVAGEKVTPEKMGPAIISGNPTIGGTTASLINYSLSGRTPVGRVKNFEELVKLSKLQTSNPIAKVGDENTGSTIEKRFKSIRELRDKKVRNLFEHAQKRLSVKDFIKRLKRGKKDVVIEKANYTKKFIGNIHDMKVNVPAYEYTNSKGTVVKVPGYSYERSGTAKEKTMAKIRSIQTKIPVKMTVGKVKAFKVHKTRQTKIKESPKNKIIKKVKEIQINAIKTDLAKFIPLDINNRVNKKDIETYEQYGNTYIIAKFQHLGRWSYTPWDDTGEYKEWDDHSKYEDQLKDWAFQFEWAKNAAIYVDTGHSEWSSFVIKIPNIKKDFTNDFIDFTEFTTDMTEDYTLFHGPITRSGPFDYVKNGEKVTLYKDWDNIKERFAEVSYLPYKLAQKGSHKAEEYGFAYNFKPDEKTEMMMADIVTIKNIEDLDGVIKDKSEYHTSIGFIDHIENGNMQIIDKLDHLAGSGTEVGRCSTGGESGKRDCIIKKVDNKNAMEMVA